MVRTRPIATIDPADPREFCARCDNRLHTGARFCTRCGEAVGVTLAKPIISGTFTPAMQAKIKRPPGVPSGWGKAGLICCFLCIGVGVIVQFHHSMPPPDLSQGREPHPPLPAAPDPSTPLDLANRLLATVAIQSSWVETDAIDADGYLGIRVHAQVLNSGRVGLRLVAHFRSHDSGPIRPDNLNYADVVGEMAVATTVPPSAVPVQVTAFLPASAWWLPRGDYRFTLTTALFDRWNNPAATGLSVPFELQHGSVAVTRVIVDKSSDAAFPPGMRVSITVPDFGFASEGQIIVVFNDSHGTAVPGRAPWINAVGELMAKADYKIPAAPGMYTLNDVAVEMPGNLTPRGAIAQIRLFDPRAGTWLTTPVRVKLP